VVYRIPRGIVESPEDAICICDLPASYITKDFRVCTRSISNMFSLAQHGTKRKYNSKGSILRARIIDASFWHPSLVLLYEIVDAHQLILMGSAAHCV
jgi:hypothetical protein